MATKIKLTRMGMKKQPTYRVVIQEQRSKRDGKFLENVGLYDPRQNPPLVQLKADRVNYWLSVGATPTDSVGRLLKMAGITDKYYHQRKQTRAPEATPTAAPEKAPAAASASAEPIAPSEPATPPAEAETETAPAE